VTGNLLPTFRQKLSSQYGGISQDTLIINSAVEASRHTHNILNCVLIFSNRTASIIHLNTDITRTPLHLSETQTSTKHGFLCPDSGHQEKRFYSHVVRTGALATSLIRIQDLNCIDQKDGSSKILLFLMRRT
jgi:hypothetical protein